MTVEVASTVVSSDRSGTNTITRSGTIPSPDRSAPRGVNHRTVCPLHMHILKLNSAPPSGTQPEQENEEPLAFAPGTWHVGVTPRSHHTHAIDAVEVTAHRMYHSIQLSGKKSRLSGKGSAKPHAYW